MSNARDIFIAAYIEAAVWADTPDDVPEAELADETRLALERVAGRFFDAHTDAIAAYEEGLVQAGHDLWFTQVGHGVGYWENHSEAAKHLDAAAKSKRLEGLYVGDDGLLYLA